MKGEIVKIIRSKGYGFINPMDSEQYDGEDIFFHHSALEGLLFENLETGTIVEFTVTETEKGPQANDISLAEGDEVEDEMEEEIDDVGAFDEPAEFGEEATEFEEDVSEFEEDPELSEIDEDAMW